MWLQSHALFNQKHLMVINYMFVRNPRLFQTLFFELEYHVQVQCQSTVGFIALLLHLFPSVK